MQNRIFLLADDDRDDTEMFSEALAAIDETIVCHCVSDGRQALDTLDELVQLPDLIFLDVNMPVMNGWQCLKALKEDDRYYQVPVIIISTSSHERDIEIASELGALCYFTKPHYFTELTGVLQVIVENVEAGLPSALRNAPESVARFIYGCFDNKETRD